MSKFTKHHLFRALGGSFVLLLFLISTNPNDVALGLLVVPILLTAFVTHELVRYGFQLFSRGSGQKRQQAISVIFGLAAGLLIMLQSIGQLAAGDLAIILFFVLISVFYINRFR